MTTESRKKEEEARVDEVLEPKEMEATTWSHKSGAPKLTLDDSASGTVGKARTCGSADGMLGRSANTLRIMSDPVATNKLTPILAGEEVHFSVTFHQFEGRKDSETQPIGGIFLNQTSTLVSLTSVEELSTWCGLRPVRGDLVRGRVY